ncbi:MAG: DUF4126 domain-containing protein [Tildeniella nuda ZEHNDER 1965/U140]|nr:DUF4126 domain-containing protein [Tildeniella nuda ZEHNDER 1965/U140]
MDTFISLLLGVSLSAACGFRVFVPLLLVSAAAIVGHLDLPTNVAWVGTDHALIAFAVASSLEIAGYYIPWFDHLLDTVATPLAIVAGTVVTAATAPDMSPLAQWTLAAIAGGGAAGLTKGLLNVLRIGSTATSGGLTNPILSTIELVASVGLSVLALTLPALTGIVVVVVLLFAAYKLWRFFFKGQPQTGAIDEATQ